MHFAAPLPWWLTVVVAIGIVGLAVWSYRRPLVPLTTGQRTTLAVLRGLSLAALALFLARPTILVPPTDPHAIVVPVLVDVSRSMRVPDVRQGSATQTRIAEASRLLTSSVLPALSQRFTPEVFTFGESLAPAAAQFGADARHTDLAGAIASVRERYRGRPVAGIVVISDGADTGPADEGESSAGAAVPIFTIGVGSAVAPRDREVVGLSAGDPRLDQATVDLKVSAVSHGFGREPFQLRVLADGRVLDTRRVTPAADGSPIDEVFTVSPDPMKATVYAAEIAPDAGEAIVENNQRSVLVSPAGRKRRVLAIEGAPGFDHSFMARALAHDRGLDLDMVVRKGKNDNGQDTFFVQAGGGRSARLTSGFPTSREALFVYDALIIANVESDFFTRAQMQLVADFVAERGGGLLVLGGRSFAQRGLIGTPLEEVLPLELNDRRGGLARPAYNAERAARPQTVTLTADGENHPIMRIGASAADSARLWAAMPALAASAPLGGPRPGANVLAVTSTPGVGVVPLIAVQRYGRGRSMVFTGEGSWRWKMMLASTDRSYEFFWRQAARWLAGPAPDPVAVTAPESSEPGDTLPLSVEVRDGGFLPVADATVTATLTVPGGEGRPVALRRDGAMAGRFSADFRPDQAGLYRVQAEARRAAAMVGTADKWFYVGGSDRELSDPRLNEGVLRRLARSSGGRYSHGDDTGQIGSWLESAAPAPGQPERRDLWHQPWAFALLIGLLAAEWTLRRRWGLR
jgi:uncharacterized membrane protein